MGKVVEQLLTGQVTNHMLPFFWQHGEDEATLREYVNAIHDANCMAFCVESRPHPDFCGSKWWQDMDVILDEAKKLGMKVWILDDSHFPTGFANGALKDAPQEVCRQSIFCKFLSYEGDAREVVFRTEKLAKPPKYKLNFIQKMMMSGSTKDARKNDDDQVYSITAYGPKGEEIDLSGSTTWKKPAGTWQVAVCGLSRNLGPHRAYINMMNEVSCHKLIEAVYEPHFAHYGDLFGNTIAGFFSDEPELGNGILYAKHNVLGTEQDLPWSKELEERLQKTLGVDYRKNLPLLWKNDGDPLLTAQVRRTYMDAVSNLVKKDFSEQIGGWCREKGVMYIGHSIEDAPEAVWDIISVDFTDRIWQALTISVVRLCRRAKKNRRPVCLDRVMVPFIIILWENSVCLLPIYKKASRDVPCVRYLEITVGRQALPI